MKLSKTISTIALAAVCLGVVLYNVGLSSLAAGLLNAACMIY